MLPKSTKRLSKRRGLAAQRAPESSEEVTRARVPDWLFAGVFPTGISYADRRREEDGDYKRIAMVFLPNAAVGRTQPELKVYADGPEYRAVIESVVKPELDRLKADGGMQVSTSGQRVDWRQKC